MSKSNFLSIITCIALFMAISIESPLKTMAAKEFVTITEEDINIREGPGLEFEVVGKGDEGDTYSLLKEEGDWFQIELNSGKKGWVANWLVSKLSGKKSDSNSAKTLTGTISADSLKVRSGPGKKFDSIGSLKKGDWVTILAEENGWMKISFLNQTAWVSKEYVVTVETNDSAQKSRKKLTGVIGTVKASTIKVRSSYSLNAKVVGSVSIGESFEILEERNNWVKIEWKKGKNGWVMGWYMEKGIGGSKSSTKVSNKKSTVTVLHNGTNIRNNGSRNAKIIERADIGEEFTVMSLKKDWFEIKLKNGKRGFIAGWMVTANGGVPQIEKTGTPSYLHNKIILIDPGHGGIDNGATGSSGSLEKDLTLRTGQLLYEKLRAAGANPILTRKTDSYLSLASRLNMSQYQNIDAFVSIHYDSIEDQTVTGTTSYFYYPSQRYLAFRLHQGIKAETLLKDRGVRFGDYHVLRESDQNASLIELGYLSNPAEETILLSSQFQDQATTGIVQGLSAYFKEQ